MKNRELMVAARDRLRNAAQLDHFSNHRFHGRPQVIGDARSAGAGGMDAIRLVQIGHAGDAFEQKRHQRDFVLAREILKHLTKSRGVLFPVVRRRLHADEQHWNRALPRAMDDALQILLHLGWRQASQPVIGAERKNQQPHIPFERPARAPQSVGRRVARHAGIDDLERDARLVQLALQHGRIRLLARDAEARGQAVAERHDDGGAGCCGCVRCNGCIGAPGSSDVALRAEVDAVCEGGAGADPPHEIAASTTRERRTRFNLLYLTVVYSRPWSPSPFSRRWRGRERPSSAAAMPTQSASSRRR